MDSNIGSANVTPTPRRNVLRAMCFLVMIIAGFLSLFFRSHLKRLAVDDPHHNRHEFVVLFFGVTNDGTNDGHVVILNASAQSIGHGPFGKGTNKLRGISHERYA